MQIGWNVAGEYMANILGQVCIPAAAKAGNELGYASRLEASIRENFSPWFDHPVGGS